MKLPTFMDLLAHIAKQHFKEEIEVKEKLVEEEEVPEKKDSKDEDEKNSIFVFHESRLDNFLEKIE